MKIVLDMDILLERRSTASGALGILTLKGSPCKMRGISMSEKSALEAARVNLHIQSCSYTTCLLIPLEPGWANGWLFLLCDTFSFLNFIDV